MTRAEAVLLAWSAAQAEVTRLRRAYRAAARACENWSPAEDPDPPGYGGYPGCAESPACFFTRGCEPRPRADWCPSCLVATPDIDALPGARKRLRAARSAALRLGHQIATGRGEP